MKLVVLGLSITSAWGNGHATTYRGLLREFTARGHEVLFLERDQPWYAEHRDLPAPSFCRVELYGSLTELKLRFADEIREADAVIVGSYVTEGPTVSAWIAEVAQGVTAFYDIDTPITLAALEQDCCEYLTRALVPRFQHYLSFTGGSTLQRLEREFGSPAAHALYCSFDPALYYPVECDLAWDLGYLGTYSADRQPALERLLLEPARRLPESRFVVAGPLYPPSLAWGGNVERIEHLGPERHLSFYNRQRFTLNVTRAAMIEAGHSPSVRLFEAAACGVPIISDAWAGLDELFVPDEEILIAESSARVVQILADLPEAERQAIGRKARARVLAEHTAAHRAAELEGILTGSPIYLLQSLQEIHP